MLGIKKKERTQEQKSRRFKFALILIAIFIVVVMIPDGKRKEAREDPDAEIRQEMDACLDSLLKTVTDLPYDITFKGDMEHVPILNDIPEKRELKRIEMEIKMLENPNIPMPNRKERIEQASTNVPYLERRISELEESSISQVKYCSRRIKFITSDGVLYTCFQQNFMGHNKIKHLKEMSSKNNLQEELNNILNNENYEDTCILQ